MIQERIEVLGVTFDKIYMEEALERGSAWLSETGFHYVVTPNPEFILMAQKDEVFRQSLNKADLVLPDGIGVIYSSKILGRPLPSRVPGIEFASGMLEQLEKTGGSLFLLGAKEGVAQVAGEKLKLQYPHIQICGTHHGYFKEDKDKEVAEIVKASGAEVLFLCLGAPRQELFLAQWGEATGIKVGIGLGGAIDVFAGNVERAPELWIKCNVEWLYRLTKEPKRVGRMAKLPLVLLQAGRERVFKKK